MLFGWIGDNITATTLDFPFTSLVPSMLGTAIAPPAGARPVVSGHPGKTSAEIAPFLQKALIDAGCDTIFLLAGAHDAEQNVPIASYAATMLGMFDTVRKAGAKLFVLTIPPPRNDEDGETARLAIDIQNYWLRQTVPQYGTLIDIHPVLVDPDTGYLIGAYWSKETGRLRNAGHFAIAQEIVRVLRAPVMALPEIGRVVDGYSTFNLVSNPWMQSGTAGWRLSPNTTGTGYLSRAADTTGLIETGAFLELDVGGEEAADYCYFYSLGKSYDTAWTNGDVLAFSAKMQVIDLSGDWLAQNVIYGGTAFGDVLVVNGNTAWPIERLGVQWPGTLVEEGVYNFGPILKTFTVPADLTSLQIWLRCKVPAGSNYKFRFGEIGVFNLTQSGLLAAPTKLTEVDPKPMAAPVPEPATATNGARSAKVLGRYRIGR
ncbi:SGNH/GDSL hydrolase family protein [Sphingomonas sp. MMS24-J13]|uniref:SGNH/GDSL hydrolase family protein n=1 Tax=Sphingomonas sp. MMS24-J13 TaxID=3238686 RepID=UPI0038514BB1